MAIRTVEMDFEFNNIISGPPVSPDQLYSQACSSDKVTINSWRQQWIDQVTANHAKYGPFADRSIGKLFKKYYCKPGVCVGSGPSLKNNGKELKGLCSDIPVISCLHNFHFFIDNDIRADYFVTLDAGEVTVEEIYEGGSKTKEEYFERTKDYTLLAFIGSNPKLLAAWKGPIYFFNCPVPDTAFIDHVKSLEEFNTLISTGGNVLGACVYIAKAIFGCNPICFVGADFAFSYTKKFHGWDSKYDKSLGNAMRAIDVWGNKVYTWQSYWNFKNFFDWLSIKVPGLYINCTEGGLLGAYPDGNIYTIMQMELSRFVRMYDLCNEIKECCEDPSSKNIKLLY